MKIKLPKLTSRRVRFILSLMLLAFMLPFERISLVSAGTATQTVVLVHGWKGFGVCIGTHKFTRGVYELGDNDQSEYDAYFDGLGTELKHAGYKVFFAELETDPCFTPHADDNVPNLKYAIDYAKLKTGENKVILIAHSMGGLVARAYIENPALYQGDVKMLFTFGTPHEGTDITSSMWAILLDQNGVDIEKILHKQLIACDFKPDFMDIYFNQKYKQNPTVSYYLISGNAPEASRTSIGKKMNNVFGAILNDGIVPTNSGLGMPGTMKRLRTSDVHAGIFGSPDYFALNTAGHTCLHNLLMSGNGGYGSDEACGNEGTLNPKVVPSGASFTCGDGRVFETGHMVTGDFLAAWEGGNPTGSGAQFTVQMASLKLSQTTQTTQGKRSYADSLYINGFPITDKRNEISSTDGKVYATQWFERARFEAHPENKPPFNVLLGLLGVNAAQARQSEEPFKPVANPGGGAEWFPETNHTLGDNSEGGRVIASFWHRLGGLPQFGFPLSQPFMEVSKDNGKTYLVQYFERQRFEYHPENNGTPYEVLLGRLGAEQVDKYVLRPTEGISPANGARLTHLQTLLGHDENVTAVAFSPDGQTLASSAWDSTVKLWRVSDGALIRTLQASNTVNSIAFSPDGQALASGGYRNITLWRISDGTQLRTIEVPKMGEQYNSANSIAFSTDSQMLALGSRENIVRLFRVSDGSLVRTFEGHTRSVSSVAFSPDGRTLASGSEDNSVLVWQVADGSLVRTLEGRKLEGYTGGIGQVAYSADSQMLLFTDSLYKVNEKGLYEFAGATVKLWHVSDWTPVRTFGDKEEVGGVSLSPDGQILVTSPSKGKLQLWRVSDGAVLNSLDTNTLYITSSAFSPDGRILVTGSDDNTVQLWGVR